MKTEHFGSPAFERGSREEAISLAERAIENGEAIRYRFSGGTLDVETLDGWRQWWPDALASDLYEGL